MKVISAVDIMGASVVRLVKGDPANKTVYSNNPVEMAQKWESEGADLLHVVDLDAALGNGNNLAIISKIIESVRIPVQVAGGLRSADSINEMLSDKKARRVVLGTVAYQDQDLVRKMAKKYPKRVVVSVDQIDGKVMVKGWKESSGILVSEAIKLFMSMGIEEFLLTSIERDGTLQGPDTATLASAASLAGKIIASGGISDLSDTIKVKSVGCSSVILGKAIYDGKVRVGQVKAIA